MEQFKSELLDKNSRLFSIQDQTISGFHQKNAIFPSHAIYTTILTKKNPQLIKLTELISKFNTEVVQFKVTGLSMMSIWEVLSLRALVSDSSQN